MLLKVCNKCGQEMPINCFYKRPYYDGTTQGHFTSECKSCMKERAKTQNRLGFAESRFESENDVLRLLNDQGIPTTTGHNNGFADVDLVAYGCVRIEVKYSRIQLAYNKYKQYAWNLTKKQIAKGLKADVIVLVGEDDNGDLSYYILPYPHDTFFHPDGTLKTAFVYSLDNAGKRAGKRHVLTNELMQSAKNNYGLITDVLQTLMSNR